MYTGFGNQWDKDGKNFSKRGQGRDRRISRNDKVIVVESSRIIIGRVTSIRKSIVRLLDVDSVFNISSVYKVTFNQLRKLGLSIEDSQEILAGQRRLPIVANKDKGKS